MLQTMTKVQNKAISFPFCYGKKMYKSLFSCLKYSSTCQKDENSGRRLPNATSSLSVLLSIQPLGILHVGNYFGALKQCIDLQNEGHHVTICIADLQALSSKQWQNAHALRDAVSVTAATMVACGIDPEKSTIVQQSKVAEHAQLDWIFNCLRSRDDPGFIHAHSKRLAGIKDVTVGQYVNPVLLCADALLYKTNCVPAGIVFRPQNEFNCQTARLFNDQYGECFPLPHALIDEEGFSSNIRNLRKPIEKMSRSVQDPRSRIEILDSPDVIKEKCKKAVTDFTSEVYFDEASRPGVSNLMALHSLVTGKDYETIRKDCSALETANYKLIVSEALNEYFSPIRDKTNELLRNREQISTILHFQATKASKKAAETMQEVYEKIGFKSEKVKECHQHTSSTLSHINQACSTSITFSNFKPETNCCSPDEPKSSRRKQIFSGIQPTGVLHLGNYFGAVRQWVALQEAGDEVTVCVVDQHAITVPQDSAILNSNVLNMAASILACGIDPDHTVLFQQSRVPQHAQLNAVLRNVVTMALLARQAHYKDKMSILKVVPSLGLFAYPILQAADILLHNASHVPVGDDQRQHIDVARRVASLFNQRFGKIFKLPEAMILDDTLARLKSLHKPMKKMSKSESDPNSRIEILDSPERIIEKFEGAVVGHSSVVDGLNMHPGVSNLMAIHCSVTGTSLDYIQQEYVGTDIAYFKRVVADAVIEHLNPVRRKAELLLGDHSSLMMILEEGARRANRTAEKTLQSVHNEVGFL